MYGRGMSEGWRQRLDDAIGAQGKSYREVSLEAGLAAGYVHGILKAGKDPSIERLVKVCRAVPVDLAHVLLGHDVSREDVQILRALRDNPKARAAILALLGDA